jgi:hypothetical protein
MTRFANVCCVDVRSGFTRGIRPIVTSRTCSQYLRMINRRRRCPRRRAVARFANVGGGYMCAALACGNCAVMTGRTTAVHLRVVYRCDRCPHRGAVAGFTQVTRIDVST